MRMPAKSWTRRWPASKSPFAKAAPPSAGQGFRASACLEFQLEQLFQNLVGNAIRYRTEQPPQISIYAERQGDWWRFAIQDNGIGIQLKLPAADLRNLQTPAHRRRNIPARAWGLAICQRIVERAGGPIWVESQPGAGSTFFFTVPRRDT